MTGASVLEQSSLRREGFNPAVVRAKSEILSDLIESAGDPLAVLNQCVRYNAGFARELAEFRKLSKLDEAPPWQPLDRESFERLYDPNLPTIGIVSEYAPDGYGYAAVQAQLRRAAGLASVNVVLMAPWAFGSLATATDSDGRSVLLVDRGSLFDENGTSYDGIFGCQIPVNLITCIWDFDNPLLSVLDRGGFPLVTSSRTLLACHHKPLTTEILRSLGLSAPENLAVIGDDLSAKGFSPSVLLEHFHGRGVHPEIEGLVVKAFALCAGEGVSLLERGEVEALSKHLHRAVHDHGQVLLEQRILSAPLTDERGTRLDWNVRVLASPLGVIDLEARVGQMKQPINKAKGAAIREVDEVLACVAAGGWSVRKPDEIRAEIYAVSTQIAQHFDSIVGVDIIIDEESGRVWTIEVNAGNIGCLSSVFALRATPENKLSGPDRLVEHLTVLAERSFPTTSSMLTACAEPLLPPWNKRIEQIIAHQLTPPLFTTDTRAHLLDMEAVLEACKELLPNSNYVRLATWLGRWAAVNELPDLAARMFQSPDVHRIAPTHYDVTTALAFDEVRRYREAWRIFEKILDRGAFDPAWAQEALWLATHVGHEDHALYLLRRIHHDKPPAELHALEKDVRVLCASLLSPAAAIRSWEQLFRSVIRRIARLAP